MAEQNTKNGWTIYTIKSSDGRTRASFIPEKGGVGCSIIMPCADSEREVLFLHDNFWEKSCNDLPGGWPFLFPICGRLERMGRIGDYLYDGHIYNLPIHGFSWQMPWRVVDAKSTDRLIIELTETKDSLAMYPFRFKVQLIYKVANGRLTCEQIYTNNDDKPLVYYAGFHPYFLTPASGDGKEQVMLDYQPVRQFRYNESLTDLCGEKKLFTLPRSIADPDINEQLTQVEMDNMVKLQYPDGFNLLLKTEGVKKINLFSYLQIYTMAEKPFICLEPWMSHPNALNTALSARYLAPHHSESGLVELATVCSKDRCCVL